MSNTKAIQIFFIVGITTVFAIDHGTLAKSDSKPVIKLILDMSPAKTVRKDGKRVPVFSHDLSADIKASLEDAGFKIVTREGESYDLVLRYKHVERMTRDPSGQTVTIVRDLGFTLQATDGILLQEERGPFGVLWPYDSIYEGAKLFLEDLVELVQLRIEKTNETACWIEFVRRRGEKASVKAIERAGNPTYSRKEEQIGVLKPLLRSYKLAVRVASQQALKKLGYGPKNTKEQAEFFIPATYYFRSWDSTALDGSVGAWAARQGLVAIIKYGIVAIDLFLEDLKGEHNETERFSRSSGKVGGGVATPARAVLKRLSQEEWVKFPYYRPLDYRRNSSDKITPDFSRVRYHYYDGLGKEKQYDEIEVINSQRPLEVLAKTWKQEWNDYAIKRLVELLEKNRDVSADEAYLKKAGIDNQKYFQDLIEILSVIADERAIKSLKSYLTHPKLSENARNAIGEIDKRSKDKASVKAIERAGNPTYSRKEEQIGVLKPLLRSYKLDVRVASQQALKKLGYSPKNTKEQAEFFIPGTYYFQRWDLTTKDGSVGAWAARQGVVAIIKYGIVAIDLFLEDLKGKQNKTTDFSGAPGGGVATPARAVLKRLSPKEWIKFPYYRPSYYRRNSSDKITSDFIRVRYRYYDEVEVINPEMPLEVLARTWKQEWNDYAIKRLVELLEKNRDVSADEAYLKKAGIDNQRYFQDLIEILSVIADERAIKSLKSYLTHPKLSENARNAIGEIDKRSKDKASVEH